MRTSEPPPSPWEIWHARFNFDRHGYKFRPVLVLSRAPSGLLAAMNIDSEATALSTKHGMAQGNNHQSHYDLHATTSISLDKRDMNPVKDEIIFLTSSIGLPERNSFFSLSYFRPFACAVPLDLKFWSRRRGIMSMLILLTLRKRSILFRLPLSEPFTAEN